MDVFATSMKYRRTFYLKRLVKLNFLLWLLLLLNFSEQELKNPMLKVSYFQKDFWYPQFFQKTNEKIIPPNYYDTSGRLVFINFWKNLTTPKINYISKLTDPKWYFALFQNEFILKFRATFADSTYRRWRCSVVSSAVGISFF